MRRLIALLLLLCPIQAATWFVATTGSNSNAGTSGAPFLTLQKGINSASAGDTVTVANGTYPPPAGTCPNTATFAAVVTTSGTAGNPITIKATNPGTPFNRNVFLTDPTVSCDGYFAISNSAYVVIQGFDISGGTNYCVDVAGTSNHVSLLNNDCHDTGHWNDQSTGGGHVGYLTQSGTSFVTIDGNVIYDTGRTNTTCGGNPCTTRDQLIYTEGTNHTISNNLVILALNSWSNWGWGIALKVTTGGILIANNTFIGGVASGIGGQIVLGDDIVTDHTDSLAIKNNLFINPHGTGIVDCGATFAGTSFIQNNFATGTGVTSVYGNTSICSTSSGYSNITQSANTVTNPLIQNLTGLNFQLSVGSPAINAGLTLSAVPTDFAGVSRPQGPSHDIGAYEFVTAAPTVTTNSISSNGSTIASVAYTATADPTSATIVARGTCYALTVIPTTPCTSDGTGSGTYSSSLTGLTPSTTYYVRSYSTNGAGTAYGSTLSFTTGSGSGGAVFTGRIKGTLR